MNTDYKQLTLTLETNFYDAVVSLAEFEKQTPEEFICHKLYYNLDTKLTFREYLANLKTHFDVLIEQGAKGRAVRIKAELLESILAVEWATLDEIKDNFASHANFIDECWKDFCLTMLFWKSEKNEKATKSNKSSKNRTRR